MERGSVAFSVLAGSLLGAATGLLLTSMMGIVGGVLVIFNSFEGDPDAFRWMIVPSAAGLLVGGAVGGAIGFVLARRRHRRSGVVPEIPVRPDLP